MGKLRRKVEGKRETIFYIFGMMAFHWCMMSCEVALGFSSDDWLFGRVIFGIAALFGEMRFLNILAFVNDSKEITMENDG